MARVRREEDGFILLESLIAISLITILLAALGTFTITTIQASTDLRARQAASQVATTTMAAVGSIPANDLVTGRDSTSVNAQFAAASSTVSPSLAGMTKAVDASATSGAGASAAISTSAVVSTLNNVAYSANTYLGTCVIATGGTSCAATGTGLTYYRAVVAVTWSGRGCSTGSCAFVSTSLISADSDPVFGSSASNPAAPSVTNPGNQVTTVGQTVSLQLAVDSGTGVSPFTWNLSAGSLPTGLTLSSTGLISGTAGVLQSATSLTVQASDAFGRTGTATFTWAVVAAPTITTPANQTSTQNTATSLAITATCPNTPCTYAVTNAPAGLTINASTGVISGTPTTAGTSSNVVVQITDAAGVSASTSAFTWRVLVAASVGSPGTVTGTVGNTKSVAIPYTCGSGSCTIALTNSVPGITLNTAANGSGTSGASLTVTATSGTLYLQGTITSAAVPTGSTSKAYAPSLTISTGGSTVATQTGSWTAYAAPTLSDIGSRNATVGTVKNNSVTYTCAFTPCTLTLTNTVPGLGLSTTPNVTTANSTTSLTVTATSGTVYVTGLVSSSAVPANQTSQTYNLTVTLTDLDSASAATTGVYTATTAPKVTNPGTLAVRTNILGTGVNYMMSASCPNGGCSWSVQQLSGSTLLTSFSISSGGRLTSSGPFLAGTYSLKVTVTDADGLTDSATFNMVAASAFTLTVPNQTTTKPTGSTTTTVTLDITPYISPGADSWTYTMSGAPSWLTLSSDGILTATITRSSASSGTITIVATTGAATTSNTVNDPFTWTLR